jgi:colanic acid/amylovoran biosynthesis glycosyltransferase
MENKTIKKLNIAFVVGKFPLVSETFIINQIADLEERGNLVDVFSFSTGSLEHISQRFFEFGLEEKTYYLDMPDNKFRRFLQAIPKLLHVFVVSPSLFVRIFNIKKYGRDALSFRLLFWIEPWLGKEKKFDLIHCHFGPVANKFLIIKELLGLKQKIVTTFYGFDVSRIFKIMGDNYYDRLKKECSLFFVMSNNMKERIIMHGFNPLKIKVLPVSIDTREYPFRERLHKSGEKINIISVGRFVEKKGFNDILKALSIVKKNTKKPFKAFIVGGGPLEKKLLKMTKDLCLEKEIEYQGYMVIEDIIEYFLNMHLFVQPSKTAQNGDME